MVAAAVAAAAAALAAAGPARAQPAGARAPAAGAACDPELAQRARGTYGYAARGDRCEGDLRAAGGRLGAVARVVHAGVRRLRPRLDARLALQWAAPAAAGR
jgi:hypothetical protein